MGSHCQMAIWAPPAWPPECAFDRGVPLSNGHSVSASARFLRLPRNPPRCTTIIAIILEVNMPAGPQPKRAPPFTARHNCPQGRSPSVHHPSQRVTNAHEAPAPTNFARHNGSQSAHEPQPQRAPPFTGRHKCPQGLSPHRPPPVTTGHKCSRRQPQAHSIRRPLWGLKACEILLLRRRPPL